MLAAGAAEQAEQHAEVAILADGPRLSAIVEDEVLTLLARLPIG